MLLYILWKYEELEITSTAINLNRDSFWDTV